MRRKRLITKKQVLASVEKWREVLHLQDWGVSVEVKKLDRPTDGIAHNESLHEYKSCVIRVDPYEIRPDQLDRVVIHELAHSVNWSLAHVANTLAGNNKKHNEWVRVEEELLTTHWERVVCALCEVP